MGRIAKAQETPSRANADQPAPRPSTLVDQPYLNPILSPAERAADLLRQMTLEEKVGQLLCLWQQKSIALQPPTPDAPFEPAHFNSEALSAAFPHGVGMIARPSDRIGLVNDGEEGFMRGPRETAAVVNAFQRHFVENTRLGIPAFFHEEGLHGYMTEGGTHFPQAIAMASTFSPVLVEEMYRLTAAEMRARGVSMALTPVVDVARDPRWGRIEETWGEDPYLTARFAEASIRGFQGTSDNSGALIERPRVVATLKHMTGHGQPESGINVAPAALPTRTLYEIFYPPFEAAVSQGAASLMPSYNEIDGVPSHASRMLEDDLRGAWGFNGVVVSDYFAVEQLASLHHVVETPEEAAALALASGVDVEMPDPQVFPLLVEAVRAGRVPEAHVDSAAVRVLRLKFRLGLFEQPYADPEAAEASFNTAEARALALRTAERAAILLKNEPVSATSTPLLPLRLDGPQRIAVIGPNAAETLLGGYSGIPPYTVSLLEGLQAYVDANGADTEIMYAEGVRLTESRSWWADEVITPDSASNAARIEEAVALATEADLVILALGGNEQTSREAWAASHPGDRTSLDLFGDQNALIEAILATGTPSVAVLIGGRPLAANLLYDRLPSILQAWYLGQETGTALASLLFGEISPSGKLPVSIPRSVGHLPVFYNYKPSARRVYLQDETTARFPFGYGLSYTRFDVSDVNVRGEVGAETSATVDITVRNVGEQAAETVVQLYIRDRSSSVTRPVRELKGFSRVALAPGEQQTVSLPITAQHLAMYNDQYRLVVEPGTFDLYVGFDSEAPQRASLTTETEIILGPSIR
ncbi:MAG: glycoside hydrolase family 3 N-terminal domain-containing protein [Bacteroidota bacterium]